MAFSLSALAQVPVVKAHGGDGRSVNWALIKSQEEADSEGPGFFYFPCDMEVVPQGASSTLAGQGSKSYGVRNLMDGNPMTAWVEGDSEYGIGEYFEVESQRVNVIYNGYQSSPSNWLNNSRVKRFAVSKNGKPLCYLDLSDEMGAQYFSLPEDEDYEMATFRFVILEVYPGLKWKDVAISEISSRGCCIAAAQVLLPNGEELGIDELHVGTEVATYHIETTERRTANIESKVSAIHVGLIEITAGGQTIVCTKDHPFYFDGFPKTSLLQLVQNGEIESIEDAVDQVQVLVWDREKHQALYVPISGVKSVDAKLTTYTIMDLNEGETFIANGFVTAAYR